MKTRRTYEILLALVALLLACCSESPRSVVPGGNNDGSVLPDDASLDAEQVVQDQPPFYVLDLQASYLNCFGGCAGQVKARGADKVLRDLDTLMVAMSIQGIVNRKGPRLYVVSTGADQFWLDQATAVGKPWAWA
ncbi:MAG: hypothetical protein KBF88_13325, partial [Polyangiaceae bacterium]|nr:hypothetical protein [Polyangiaceae bacterium]